MKNQALFSLKGKKLKCRLLQFLFGALRVRPKTTSQPNLDLQARCGENIHKKQSSCSHFLFIFFIFGRSIHIY